MADMYALTPRGQKGVQNRAVYNRGGQVHLDRVEFHDNEATGDGATVTATRKTSHTVIENSDFHENRVDGAGGAVAVRGAGAQLKVIGAERSRATRWRCGGA